MASFEKFAPVLWDLEGGYVDDPDDRGGETNRGITLKTYEGWCRKHGYPRPTVQRLKDLDSETWARITKELFWDKVGGDDIRDQRVANLIADWAFNSGTGIITRVQALVGVRTDGIVGRETVRAINAEDPARLAADLKRLRTSFYHTIARRGNNRKYLRGWLTRLERL